MTLRFEFRLLKVLQARGRNITLHTLIMILKHSEQLYSNTVNTRTSRACTHHMLTYMYTLLRAQLKLELCFSSIMWLFLKFLPTVHNTVTFVTVLNPHPNIQPSTNELVWPAGPHSALRCGRCSTSELLCESLEKFVLYLSLLMLKPQIKHRVAKFILNMEFRIGLHTVKKKERKKQTVFTACYQTN